MTAHIVTVGADGRLTLPDELVVRWRDRTVLLADLGDRLVMREATARRGNYEGRRPGTLEQRTIESEGR